MPLRFPDDPLYNFLRNEDVESFNQQKPAGIKVDFHDCDFRGLDLRGLNAAGIDFSGSYFRSSDLRGIDFSKANMNGSSLASAKISGCLFHSNLSAAEILLSVEKGVRMRATAKS